MTNVRNDVAAMLKADTEPTPEPIVETPKVGDLVKIKEGAKYYSGKNIPNWVMVKNWYIKYTSKLAYLSKF